MRRALGWMCYRTVMMWPGAWPSGAVAGWILAWAGDYANDPPNQQYLRDIGHKTHRGLVGQLTRTDHAGARAATERRLRELQGEIGRVVDAIPGSACRTRWRPA